MAYPSTISSFTNPSPSDKLSTTPHSTIETAQNTDLTALETFVGTESSLVGTLMYDIRGAGSNGGGHVQTANKGGTGQTAFTKGDILVATSSSVIAKLAVSAADNDFLTVDSSVAAGVKWAAGVTSGQVQNMAFQNATDTGTGSVYSISPVPCVIGYSAGQLFTFQANTTNTVASPTLSVSSLVGRRMRNPDGTALNVGQIAASALTMVQYDGISSVFQLLSQKNGAAITKFASGTASKDASDASTTQNLAHGLGVTPKRVRITASAVQAAGNANPTRTAITVYDGTTQSSLSNYNTSGANNTVDNTFTLNVHDGSDTQRGVVTFDSTNIIITWTKTSAPTGSYTLLWEAEA